MKLTRWSILALFVRPFQTPLNALVFWMITKPKSRYDRPPEFYELLGNHFLQMQSNKRAETILRLGIERHPDYFPTYLRLGALLYHRGQENEALSIFERAAAINRNNEYLLLYLSFLYDRFKRNDDLKSILAETVEKFPNCVSAHKHYGDFLRRNEQYDEAKREFDIVFAKNPNDDEAHVSMGNTFEKMNDLDKAERHYRQAIELRPDNVIAWKSLVRVKVDRGDSNESQAETCRAAAERFPNETIFWENLGMCSWYDEDFESALAFAERALQIKPHDVRILLDAAYYSMKLDDADKARRRLTDALEFDPDMDDERVEELKNFLQTN